MEEEGPCEDYDNKSKSAEIKGLFDMAAFMNAFGSTALITERFPANINEVNI